jgi:HEPN domain-containing protein
MSPRFDSRNPHAWLEYARADLQIAQKMDTDSDLVLQLRCFHLQQAAEKSIKAVLTQKGSIFPFTNNLDILISLVKNAGIPWDLDFNDVMELSAYASARIYPGALADITPETYYQATAIAEKIYIWATRWIEANAGKSELDYQERTR